MANYNLVVNSRFQPFSYQELYTPLVQATQAQYDIEDKYSELSNKANVWEGMANKESDYRTYKQYEKYSNDLKKAADQLVKEGLTPSSRKGLFDLRSRYSSEITPIEQAYQARAEEIKEQRAGRISGMIYEGDASIASLDRYLGNTNVRYNMANSQEGYKRVAAAANALSKQLSSYGSGKRIDAYTKTWLQNHGYQEHQINQAINDIRATLNGNPNQKGQGILQDILNQEMQTAGVANWKDNNAKLDYFNRVSPAIYEAIGQTNVSPYEDRGAILAAQQRASQQIAAQQQGVDNSRLAINPLELMSTKDREAIQEYAKYFYTDKDGSTKLSQAGLKEYQKINKFKQPSMPGSGTSKLMNEEVAKYINVLSDFRKFMDKIGANKYITKEGKMQPGNIGNLWNQYNTKNPNARFDTTVNTEYDYPIDETQQAAMKNSILTANRGLKLKEVDSDSKSKKFSTTGNTLDMEDLNSDKYKVVSTRFSPYGSTVMIKDDKGDVKRYKMPSGINTYNEEFRDKTMNILSQIQERINKSTSDIQRQALKTAYDEQLQKAYLYHSQLGVQNKTKEQEFNPYGY